VQLALFGALEYDPRVHGAHCPAWMCVPGRHVAQ